MGNIIYAIFGSCMAHGSVLEGTRQLNVCALSNFLTRSLRVQKSCGMDRQHLPVRMCYKMASCLPIHSPTFVG